MAYTARGLIDYARSLADLQETRFISYSDEILLINEAYRDVYSQYTESDGDYWDEEVILPVSSAVEDPNNQFAYLIPLPADFLKIRSLSYNNGGFWLPVNKFSMSNRDNNPSQPAYRLKNGNLWIIGGKNVYSQLKLNYYTTPQVLTAPAAPVALGSAETVYTVPSITSHTYDAKNGMYYYIKGTSIYAEDVDSGTTNIIYVAAFPIDGLQYWAGYLYFRNDTTDTIWRGAVAAAMIPAAIVGPATVQSFNIQANTIYYVTATETRSCGLTGATDALVSASAFPQYQLFGTSALSIVASALYIDGMTTGIAASQVRNDGIYFYVQAGAFLYQYNLVGAVPTMIDSVAANVVLVGTQISGDFIALADYESVQALSLVLDTVLDYPTNEVNEILAYTSAIAYSRKQNEAAKIATLSGRLGELWARFWSVNKRDQYQFTRINNDYQQTLNNW